MEKKQTIFFFWLFLALGSAAFLTGCGKKGPPGPPEGSTYAYPGQYPPAE